MDFNFDDESETQLSHGFGYSATITGAEWFDAGVLFNFESAYKVKSSSKNYINTINSGYPSSKTNLCEDKKDNLLHFMKGSSTLTNNHSDYNFYYGIIEVYTTNNTAAAYPNFNYSTDAIALAISFDFIVATLPASDLTSWTKETVSSTSSKSTLG